MTDDPWKDKLTPEQYRVLRLKQTESPFSGQLLDNDKDGNYLCAACGQMLFSSDTKFDSTTPGLIGWPSFSEVAKNSAVEVVEDNSFGMHRQEVICKNCGSHLGHFFLDEASSNGQHYCINSAALDFKETKQTKTDKN